MALGLAAVLITVGAPVLAQTTGRFEDRDAGISFVYPANWSILPREPRGLLGGEIFSVGARGDRSTSFLVAVYLLDPPVTDLDLDNALDSQDAVVFDRVQKLPAGRLLDVYDITVDDLDGRQYDYLFVREGQLIRASTIMVPDGDRAIEISQSALDSEYAGRTPQFDAIFSSLLLPWRQPSAGQSNPVQGSPSP